MPVKGRVVTVMRLYTAYSKNASRFHKPVSMYRFCRILDRAGYRRRCGLNAGYFEDLTIV